MKCKELQVGDKVALINGIIATIIEVSENYAYAVLNGYETMDPWEFNDQDNHPEGIPITPEILEKNGWKLSHGFYWSPNEEGAGVGLSSETGYVWDAYIGRQPLRNGINSVSDLQHLLFGLGINQEMEV